MTSQAMEVIITIGIPAMILMFIVGLSISDSRTQELKMRDEIREGKIDTTSKGWW